LKELIPEFYEGDGEFLTCPRDLDLGKLQDGTQVDSVSLPPWAKSPKDFVEKSRAALESEFVSERLHLWIDLIFGWKQRGDAAMEADNLFYHLTYDTALDEQLTSELNADARQAISAQMKEFGQTPRQLFYNPHPKRAKTGEGESKLPSRVSSRVYTCGVGKQGQLGLGSDQSHTIPKCIEHLNNLGVIQVACGGSEFDTGYTAALVHTGDVYTWGSGAYGKLGHGDNATVRSPKQVMSLHGQLVTQIACGSGHMGGLTTSGKIYTWGWGMQGQLGHGTNGNASVPTAVKSLGGVCGKQIACGEAHTVMCTASGDVFSWGWGEKGQLGHNDIESVNTPKLLKELQGCKIVQVACGLAHTAAVSDQYTVYAWGWDQYGQLGLGSFSFGNVKMRPNEVKALSHEPFFKVACGGSYTFGLTKQGSLYSFGWGKDGQLGLGWRTDRSNPKVLGAEIEGAVGDMSCCGSHVVCSTQNGALYSWGNGDQGKLGHSPGTNISSPMLIDGLKDKCSIQSDCTGGITDGHSVFLVIPLPEKPLSMAPTTGSQGAPPVPDVNELDALLGLDDESVAEAVDVSSELERNGRNIATGQTDNTLAFTVNKIAATPEKIEDPHKGECEHVAGMYEKLATVAQTTEAAILMADDELCEIETKSMVANQLVVEFDKKAQMNIDQDLVSPGMSRDLGEGIQREMMGMMGTSEALERQKLGLQSERQGALDECQRQVQGIVGEAMSLQDRKLNMKDKWGEASRPMMLREQSRLKDDAEATGNQLESIAGQITDLEEREKAVGGRGKLACLDVDGVCDNLQEDMTVEEAKLRELKAQLEAQEAVVGELSDKLSQAKEERDHRYESVTKEEMSLIKKERLELEAHRDMLQVRHNGFLSESGKTEHQLTVLIMQEERCSFLISALGGLVDQATKTMDGITNIANRSGGGLISEWKQKVKQLESNQASTLRAAEDNVDQCGKALQGVQSSLSLMKTTAEDLKVKVRQADEEVPTLEAQKKTAVGSRDFKGATRISQEIKVLAQARQENQGTLDGILRDLFLKEREASMLLKEEKRYQEELDSETKRLLEEKMTSISGFIEEVSMMMQGKEEPSEEVVAEEIEAVKEYLDLELDKCKNPPAASVKHNSVALLSPILEAEAPPLPDSPHKMLNLLEGLDDSQGQKPSPPVAQSAPAAPAPASAAQSASNMAAATFSSLTNLTSSFSIPGLSNPILPIQDTQTLNPTLESEWHLDDKATAVAVPLGQGADDDLMDLLTDSLPPSPKLLRDRPSDGGNAPVPFAMAFAKAVDKVDAVEAVYASPAKLPASLNPFDAEILSNATPSNGNPFNGEGMTTPGAEELHFAAVVSQGDAVSKPAEVEQLTAAGIDDALDDLMAFADEL